MPTRKPRPDTAGRPAHLDDPEKRKLILGAIATGVPLTHAANLAGVAPSSIRSWVTQGTNARQRADDGQPPEPTDERYLSFLADLERARAQVSARAMANIQKAAKGGYVRKTRSFRDEEGRLVTETDYADVDWKASAWVLERTFRSEFGKSTYVDLSVVGSMGALGLPEAADAGGAGGGSGLPPGQEVEPLLRALQAAAERAREVAAEDIVDAVVVPDGDGTE